MAKKYNMWGKIECPYCLLAQAELTNRKLTHTFHIMDDNLEELDKIKEAHQWSTVPLITCENTDGSVTFIGGFTDLKEKLSAEES
jgi:glutaredoxin